MSEYFNDELFDISQKMFNKNQKDAEIKRFLNDLDKILILLLKSNQEKYSH